MWKPISFDEFMELYCRQTKNLETDLRLALMQFRVPVCRAIIRRSESTGDEFVFYVAKKGESILYYDDVENGFNFSSISRDNRVLNPGGSQMDLADAIKSWLM